VNEQEISVLSW